MIGCPCAVCTSADPRNRRTRTSLHVVMDGLHVQVDAAPEFRLQCLKEGVGKVDLFVLTHGHSDHIAGMDDLRRFCDLRGGEAMEVYSTQEGMARVRAVYPYAIRDRPASRGYPAFRLAAMPPRLEFPRARLSPRFYRTATRKPWALSSPKKAAASGSPITRTARACRGRRSSWPGGATRPLSTGSGHCLTRPT
jgi:ribonuclease BN (tRNA processing enzyme)